MKITKTFTISEEIFKKFDEISKVESINKSLFIENSMKNFLDKRKKEDDRYIQDKKH